MTSDITPEMIEAAAQAMVGDRWEHLPEDDWLPNHGSLEPGKSSYRWMAEQALTAALAVQARTHVVVRRDDAMDVVASLAATISVIERTPQARKAAMSDKAFGIMLDDYTKALARGRAMLAASTEDGK